MIAKVYIVAMALAAFAAGPARAQLAAERLPACLACHGADGTPAMAGVPALGGEPPDYLLVQLVLFREKQRIADPMNAMAEGLSDDDLRDLADRLSKLPPPKPVAAGAALQTQGAALVEKYRCGSCHGAGLAGHDQIPRIAGQHADYLAAALTAYKTNTRAGYEPAMNEVSQEVADADIAPLAAYLSSLP